MEEKVSLLEGIMHVEKAGDRGESVVLVHGTASYHFCWKHVTEAFANDFRVLVPDLIG